MSVEFDEISKMRESADDTTSELKQYEPRLEKIGFLHMQKNADQLRSNCAAHQRLCFRYTDSTIPLLF